MSEFLKRLTSRKFLLTLGSFITFIALGQYVEAVGVVLGFLGVEGFKDIRSAGQ